MNDINKEELITFLYDRVLIFSEALTRAGGMDKPFAQPLVKFLIDHINETVTSKQILGSFPKMRPAFVGNAINGLIENLNKITIGNYTFYIQKADQSYCLAAVMKGDNPEPIKESKGVKFLHILLNVKSDQNQAEEDSAGKDESVRKPKGSALGMPNVQIAGIHEKFIIAWDIDRPLDLKFKIEPSELLKKKEANIAKLDKLLNEASRHLPRENFNALILGVDELQSSSPPPNGADVILKPIFSSWLPYVRANERHEDLITNDASLRRPLHIAILLKVEEGYIIAQYGEESALIPTKTLWMPTCYARLEIMCMDDLFEFKLERTMALMLHAQTGFRVHAEDIQIKALVETTTGAPLVPPNQTVPCVLAIVEAKKLHYPGIDTPPGLISNSTFKYIFRGRRDRQYFKQRKWNGECWGEQEAYASVVTPQKNLDPSLRLLLTILRHEETKEELIFT